ncbi:hypothetical protein V6N13_008257 [Hibiscus sabdariffa]
MHKPLQRNLARYRELGSGVIGSTAHAFPCPSADHARGIRGSLPEAPPIPLIRFFPTARPPLGTDGA